MLSPLAGLPSETPREQFQEPCGPDDGGDRCSVCGVETRTPKELRSTLTVGAPFRQALEPRPQEQRYRAVQPTSSMAQASLILGRVALPIIGSVLAVVFGHAALQEIDRSGEQLSGRGMAQVGLVLGYTALGLEALSIVLFLVLPLSWVWSVQHLRRSGSSLGELILGGVWPQAVTVGSILSRQASLPLRFGPTAVLDRQ